MHQLSPQAPGERPAPGQGRRSGYAGSGSRRCRLHLRQPGLPHGPARFHPRSGRLRAQRCRHAQESLGPSPLVRPNPNSRRNWASARLWVVRTESWLRPRVAATSGPVIPARRSSTTRRCSSGSWAIASATDRRRSDASAKSSGAGRDRQYRTPHRGDDRRARRRISKTALWAIEDLERSKPRGKQTSSAGQYQTGRIFRLFTVAETSVAVAIDQLDIAVVENAKGGAIGLRQECELSSLASPRVAFGLTRSMPSTASSARYRFDGYIRVDTAGAKMWQTGPCSAHPIRIDER